MHSALKLIHDLITGGVKLIKGDVISEFARGTEMFSFN